eukprot:scaffold24096_cov64-Phaeocystis_antarctica.AAC.2
MSDGCTFRLAVALSPSGSSSCRLRAQRPGCRNGDSHHQKSPSCVPTHALQPLAPGPFCRPATPPPAAIRDGKS